MFLIACSLLQGGSLSKRYTIYYIISKEICQEKHYKKWELLSHEQTTTRGFSKELGTIKNRTVAVTNK
jgi:hypothetical protein